MIARLIQFVLVLFFLSSISSCKTQNLFSKSSEGMSFTKADSVFYSNELLEYTIRQDDKLSISIWGQDQLSVGSVYGIYNSNQVYGKWLQVDVNGHIELPKIGTFKVKGLTVPHLKDSLKSIFKEWVINPVVDVKVLNKEITILGEVRNPGVIQIDHDTYSLLDLVAKCSGFEFYANVKKIKVLRQIGEDVAVTTIDLTRDSNVNHRKLSLIPGDVVIVPSKGYKEFDKRISVIIPLSTTVSAAAIIMGLF